jgi:flagellar assembly factor FliW
VEPLQVSAARVEVVCVLIGTASTIRKGTDRVTSAAELPELTFRSGLPGFPDSRRFALVRWGSDDGPYSVLVDLDAPEIRFLVVPPEVFFPDYSVDLDDATAAKIHLIDPANALILLIVSLGDCVDEATANLLGPIVINTATHEGVQAILADSHHGTRVLLAAASAA